MEKTKVFGALRATTFAALAAGGLMFATAGCCTPGGGDGDAGKAAGSGVKSCGGDKSCGDKSCGEKSCGEKSCGDKAGGEKSCGDKAGGEKSCGEKSCG